MTRCLNLPDPFPARTWLDAVSDVHGMDAFGPYAEVYWLPHIGPTAYVLARRLLAQSATWPKEDLATSVGVSHGGGRSVLERSLERLVIFRLAQVTNGSLYVRRYWPRIPTTLLARLPRSLQEAEAALAAA